MIEPLLPVREPVAARLAGSPLVVMLDVDGTLAPIAARPEEATVPLETRQAVSALASRPGVHVALVSGRAAADARRMVSAANTWVVGNHGFEISGPDGEEIVNHQASAHRPAIGQAARRIAPQIARVPGVILEDKRYTLSVHYRLADPGVLPRLRGLVEETARQHGLVVTEGKKVLEVRPPARIDKGTGVTVLALRLHALEDAASIVFIGDDRTDEDAFRVLRSRGPRPVTVRVSNEAAAETSAEFTVRDTEEVRAFLEWLFESRAGALRRS